MANVAEYKKKIVNDIVKLTRDYPIMGIVNMEDLPAPQLQAMRSELRGKIDLFMTKKRLMKIALDKIKNEKKDVELLAENFEGMPALIFTKENPFKLSKMLQKSKTNAPAKTGQTAPDDIVIKKGPTPFAPGPIISELSGVGLKVGVEGGKVAVKEDTVIVKKGDKIKPKVAEILARLDIKPMEVGLGLVAAYENGIIYQKNILKIDEAAFNQKVNLAALQSFNLAFNIAYPTRDNINLLVSKAFNDAKAIGINQNILDRGIIDDLLGKAERSMLSLKNEANIEVVKTKREAKEKTAEEKPAVQEKEKPQEVKVEVKKEEPRPEIKKEKVEEKKIEKKEEKVLEEEKKIIEEEKKLEKEKPREIPSESEVQEAVKKEEEKKLEKERIEKEKELETVEKQKERPKPEVTKEERTWEDVDEKVKAMVDKAKKFAKGTEETAADVIADVKKEEAQEKKEEEIEEQKKEEKVPSAHDLKEQKEAKEENKENKEQKEVEELAKELLKKGTLRK